MTDSPKWFDPINTAVDLLIYNPEVSPEALPENATWSGFEEAGVQGARAIEVRAPGGAIDILTINGNRRVLDTVPPGWYRVLGVEAIYMKGTTAPLWLYV